MTKLTMPHARFVRRPIFIRGKKSLSGCKGLTTGRFCRFDLEGTKETLFIGDNCEMGDLTHIVAHERVEIGKNVLIASKCFISDTSHGSYSGLNQDSPDTTPNTRSLLRDSVVIGNNVWIGENVVILPGTIVGDGCVIGANAVLKGIYEKKTIIVGVPGKSKKHWNDKTNKWEKL